MSRWKRKRVTTDVNLQGKLCLRVVLYWVICCATITALLTGRGALGGVDSDIGLGVVLRAALASFLVLPLALFDCLVFSNRFAGPSWRLRQALDSLANGQDVGTIQLREKDEFRDLADSVNRIAKRLETQEHDLEPELSSSP